MSIEINLLEDGVTALLQVLPRVHFFRSRQRVLRCLPSGGFKCSLAGGSKAAGYSSGPFRLAWSLWRRPWKK
jgi:hypothetical protein